MVLNILQTSRKTICIEVWTEVRFVGYGEVKQNFKSCLVFLHFLEANKERYLGPHMVAHAFNFSILEAEAVGSRPA